MPSSLYFCSALKERLPAISSTECPCVTWAGEDGLWGSVYVTVSRYTQIRYDAIIKSFWWRWALATLLWESVCAERFSDSAWQESSAYVDSRPSGATAARFDLDSHCRLFCVLGLAECEALDTPWTSRGTHFCALPPLKDQVSLFKAEGALCNPTATTSQITFHRARHKSATVLEDWNGKGHREYACVKCSRWTVVFYNVFVLML